MMTGQRKSHTKSRKGCLECKKRHIKCSETRPQCANCSKLKISCIWPDFRKLVTDRRSPLGSSNTPLAEAGDPSPGKSIDALLSDSLSIALQDMVLLHHWTLNVALTLNTDSSLHYLWQSTMVDLGFRHHYLLHGILAVSAVHKATIYPTESESLLVQSTHHINLSLRQFTALLSSPDPTTCVPMFATSSMLAVHTLGEAQVQEPPDPIMAFCSWARLVRGVQTVITPNWIRLQNSEMAPLILRAMRCGHNSKEYTQILRLKDLVHGFLADEDTAATVACLEAIDELHTTFQEALGYNQEQPRLTMIIAWPATVADTFIDLVYQKHPVPLVILAYFAVLFRLSKTEWWTRNWDKRIIGAVQMSVPPEYYPWLNGVQDEIV